MFPITIAITRLLKKKPNEYLITTHEVNKEACDQIVVTLRDKFGNDIGSNVINITPTNINTGDYWIVIFHGLTVEIDYPKILNVKRFLSMSVLHRVSLMTTSTFILTMVCLLDLS